MGKFRNCADSAELSKVSSCRNRILRSFRKRPQRRHPPTITLLTAWNYQDEIITKVRHAGNFKTKIMVPIPFVRIVCQ